jgi:2,4-dienoyl-CoA reductase-like NADH-dependent reductase (Old Yellow Enzyme family)
MMISPRWKTICRSSAVALALSVLYHLLGPLCAQFLANSAERSFQKKARDLLSQMKTISRAAVNPFSKFVWKMKEFKNCVIKAATYEALCDKNGVPLPELAQFHSKMAAGGCGMSIVAYGAISADGRSFPAQLICREQSIPMLKQVTSALHEHGCQACIQLTHAGYFSDRSLSESKVLSSYHEQMSAQSIFNPASFSFCRAMSDSDKEKVCLDFVTAARVAVRSGFDCLEIHCGHGYLLSQFISPKLNPNQSFLSRISFPLQVLRSIRAALNADGSNCLIMVKMNLSDGVKDGLSLEESAMLAVEFAKSGGVDIIGLSGGLILENGLYMLRGEVPLGNMISATTDRLKKFALLLFGNILIPKFPYEERYFQDPALYVAKKLQQWKETTGTEVGAGGEERKGEVRVCYMGGVQTYESLMILTEELGFDFVQSGRAILHDANIVNRWESQWQQQQQHEEIAVAVPVAKLGSLDSLCSKCNRCIVDATMKQKPISCVEW